MELNKLLFVLFVFGGVLAITILWNWYERKISILNLREKMRTKFIKYSLLLVIGIMIVSFGYKILGLW